MMNQTSGGATAGKVVLFDLDGTLVNSASGIIAAFQVALAQIGQDVPSYEELLWIVGPPLRRNFESILDDHSLVEAGIAAYRQAYSAGGIFDAQPYDGIFECLEQLKRDDFRLFVCTAKPAVFGRQVVAHFGFDSYFEAVYGAELDGRFEDKADLIAHMMLTENFSASDALMIGDRDNDTKSAARNAMKSIGVLWGFGDEAELSAGGATQLCAAPQNLAAEVSSFFS